MVHCWVSASRRTVESAGERELERHVGGVLSEAVVIVLAVKNLAVRWVLDTPAIPREVLVDELTRLATAYLATP